MLQTSITKAVHVYLVKMLLELTLKQLLLLVIQDQKPFQD